LDHFHHRRHDRTDDPEDSLKVMDLAGKQIAVLGAGGSGYAAAALALSRGALVRVFDSGSPETLAAAVARFAALGAPLTSGETALEPPHSFDTVVVSPGIDTASPIARSFAAASGEFIGEIEFAWRFCDAPVIGITGTNGKTTTTALIAAMLQAAGLRAIAAGNIGLPFSDVILSGVRHDWVVLELSSFQLETITSLSPRVAVWMNFAPDHLDRYTTVDEYFAAKLRLFDYLGEDALVIRKEESDLGITARTTTFSAFSTNSDLGYLAGEIVHAPSGRRFPFAGGELQGKHNAENVMAALAVADELGLDWDALVPAIREFQAPPHRCEKVALLGGALYLNDSKSTNLHSLESALAGQDAPVVLIAGGKNKGLDFAELRGLAARMVRECVCIGEIADHIAEAWHGVVPCQRAGDLGEAVEIARRVSRPGEIVLFSPGTSSFDMFSGYEARGEAFRSAVRDRAIVEA
jgi:UDP-N-acetylmuramoylalanine--D-glutamate ligase